MSDQFPKPLASINALRAHLKLLERGVDSARSRRVGPAPAPVPVPVTTPRRDAASGPMRPNMPFPLPARAASDKPKARSKNGADFGSFFGSIDKRAAS